MFFSDGNGQYSYLSPFSEHPITEKGVEFKSVYHYYVYNKFILTDPYWAKASMKIESMRKLIQIGNSRRHRIIPCWDSKKYDIMKKGYESKFQQHKDIKQKLIDLKESNLKYNAQPEFKYWSCYGKNMLGQLLMELKNKYSKESAPEPKPVPVKKEVAKPETAHTESLYVKPVEVKECVDVLYQVPIPVLHPSLAGSIKPPTSVDKYKRVLASPINIKPKNKVAEIVSALEISSQKTQDTQKTQETQKSQETQETQKTQDTQKTQETQKSQETQKTQEKTSKQSLSDKFFTGPDNIKQYKIDTTDVSRIITQEYEKLKNTQKLSVKHEQKEEGNKNPVVKKINGNTWLKNLVAEKPIPKPIPKPCIKQKELIVIYLDSLDNKVENSICIPLAEKKLITGEEVDDNTLISISKKLNELDVTKEICLKDTTGWYSSVLYNLNRAIAGKSVDLKTTSGKYVQGIMDRNPELVM